jgi:ribosome maturation factor RimP
VLRLYIDRPAGAEGGLGTGGIDAEGVGAEGIGAESDLGAEGDLPTEGGGLDSQGGITLGDCELVSGQVGALLDVEDPLPGRYSLEVSSPGVDRRLRTRSHFERFVGSEVRVELKRADRGRRRFRGPLRGVEGEEILIDVDGEGRRFRLDDIAEARLVPRL